MHRANRTTASLSPRAAPHGDAAERKQRERARRRHELHLELDEVALIEVVLAKLTEVEHQHVGACDGEHVRPVALRGGDDRGARERRDRAVEVLQRVAVEGVPVGEVEVEVAGVRRQEEVDAEAVADEVEAPAGVVSRGEVGAVDERACEVVKRVVVRGVDVGVVVPPLDDLPVDELRGRARGNRLSDRERRDSESDSETMH